MRIDLLYSLRPLRRCLPACGIDPYSPSRAHRSRLTRMRGSTQSSMLRRRIGFVYRMRIDLSNVMSYPSKGLPACADRPWGWASSAQRLFTAWRIDSPVYGFSWDVEFTRMRGIDREQLPDSQAGTGLPRMRGDRPSDCGIWVILARFTPHARGSTPVSLSGSWLNLVYPACAGIDRYQVFLLIRGQGLPRMRGDRPIQPDSVLPCMSFTPHARGSTSCLFVYVVFTYVYPACAGIDPPQPLSH